ncbi:MAG: MOSC domain-containing protein, partial [Flavobacteriales bacterium]|nr:MOSC domain-containing protein [Flavobacteriales bacterium]
MSLSLASIHVYPVKSLGGFEVAEARLTDRGLEHDRRWMLVDGNGRFVSQREVQEMACLHTSPSPEGFRVTDIRNGDTLDLPWELSSGPGEEVVVWEDRMSATKAMPAPSAWFSARLQRTLELVYMPDHTERNVDRNYAEGITSFSDGFPYLIISQASLDELNARIPMGERVSMERFRPNLVVAGGVPFQEDAWSRIHVGAARFDVVKPCSRCIITTTDQRTGERSKEPLRTLATFRRDLSPARTGKVDFGMNA